MRSSAMNVLPVLTALAALVCASGQSADEAAFARVEHFVIDALPPSGGDVATGIDGAHRARAAAVVRLSARGAGGRIELESDASFARENEARGAVRIMAVEELRPERAELSWREVAAGAGRSLRAEWREREDALDVVEWGNGPRLRERLWSDEGALLPLYLLELLRKGRLTSGSVPCFDPLSRTIERYTIRTTYADFEVPPGRRGERGRRTAELVRVDGTIAGSYRFDGVRLVAFQLRQGATWARAIDESEYERARAELDPPAAAR